VKILYLCPDFGIPVLGNKGASVHVRALVAAFERAGHSVVLAAPMRTKSPWDEPADIEGRLLSVKPSDELAAAVLALKAFTRTLGMPSSLPGELRRILYNHELGPELKRRFQGDPPDFIYERASLYSIAAVSLADALGVPLIVELNAPLAIEQETYRSAGLQELAVEAERWTLSQADAVLAVSEPLREHALSLGVEASRVHVLPNGVDTALFHPGSPERPPPARRSVDDELVLGFVGGLRPWHGTDALPPLLAGLLPRYPDLRLVILGDGALRAELEHDLDERGLTHNVQFTGWLPHHDVPDVIRQFDAAVVPYGQPNGHPFYFSPLKLFECMACGVPVVAAGVGQIAEVVADGETGLLYPPGELDALTAACDRLLADSQLRRRLGEAGARRIHAGYTWDRNAEHIARLAGSLIEAGRNAT
jgi:glycosyltransferase involved in cell wall biosynthesis